MKSFRMTLMACLMLTACGGNPFVPETTTGSGTGTTDGSGTGTTDPNGGITTDGGLPPGTASPTASTAIQRFEPSSSGSGYVKSVTYDSANDTFKVDNLAFDGNNVFARGASVGSLGPYAVYEGKAAVPDTVTGSPITQLQHRALYGVSSDGAVSFALVRTGSYIDYGFGGFIYTRTNGVTLPTEGVGTGNDPQNPDYRGQAHFEGTAAGIRDFNGNSGLEYTTADMSVDIDYDDFNDGNGVKGTVSNRRIYDIAGNDITADVLTALSADSKVTQNDLPVIRFIIGPGVMNDNGEIVGLLKSYYRIDTGDVKELDSGKYYAVVSGADADQKIVGVFVVESDDPRFDSVKARETSGFILSRQ